MSDPIVFKRNLLDRPRTAEQLAMLTGAPMYRVRYWLHSLNDLITFRTWPRRYLLRDEVAAREARESNGLRASEPNHVDAALFKEFDAMAVTRICALVT